MEIIPILNPNKWKLEFYCISETNKTISAFERFEQLLYSCRVRLMVDALLNGTRR